MAPMLQGLLNTFLPDHIVVLVVGIIAGVIVGALPGLTATMALAILVPFTFAMDPSRALVMLGALLVASSFGDAIPACLINTPGTPSAVATTFDGFQLSKQGKAQHAIVAACFSSMLGGIVGGAALLLFSRPLVELSLRFGPPEYFWLGILGLTLMGSLVGDSIWKGLAAGALGLLFSTVGIAPAGATVRYGLGIPALQGGIELVAALIGLFAVPELLRMVEERRVSVVASEYRARFGVVSEVVSRVLHEPLLLLRSTLIGIAVGILPGVGAPVASLVAYNEAKRTSRNKSQFGRGAIEGVIAPEVANNAVAPASMIPTLALGVPGSPPAAVILGALLLHGIRPGAELFVINPVLPYTFTWAMIVAAVWTFLIGVVLARFIARLVTVPAHWLVPAILLFCTVGAFAARNNFFDVAMMLLFGTLGYGLQKLGFPAAPIVLGLILGPIIEANLVSSLALAQAQGSILSVFLFRPVSGVLALLTVASLVRTRVRGRERGLSYAR